jgi:hypothetical protein
MLPRGEDGGKNGLFGCKVHGNRMPSLFQPGVVNRSIFALHRTKLRLQFSELVLKS